MAQSATTVTPPNPTPPTNMPSVGATPPLDPAQSAVDDGITRTFPTSFSLNENIPPSGPSASPQAFAAKTAAAGSGTSVDAEGKGTEVVVTATSPNPGPVGQLKTFSDLGNYTTTPNSQHASSLSPATNPTLTNINPTTAVSGASGTDTITCTGTNFTPQSVVYRDGIAMPTTYVSATSITAAVRKRTSAGGSTITVITGGVVTTAGQPLTYS